MQTSDGEESRALREGGVRGADEGVPSQPLCEYLNGQHDRHGKATKGFSRPKRDIKKLAISLPESQQDRRPGWLGGFLSLQAASLWSIPLAVKLPRNRILSLSVIGLHRV